MQELVLETTLYHTYLGSQERALIDYSFEDGYITVEKVDFWEKGKWYTSKEFNDNEAWERCAEAEKQTEEGRIIL